MKPDHEHIDAGPDVPTRWRRVVRLYGDGKRIGVNGPAGCAVAIVAQPHRFLTVGDPVLIPWFTGGNNQQIYAVTESGETVAGYFMRVFGANARARPLEFPASLTGLPVCDERVLAFILERREAILAELAACPPPKARDGRLGPDEATPARILTAADAGDRKDVVRCLFSDKTLATVHAPDTGATPLHLAVKGGHLRMVKALLQADARPRAEDARGQTPVQLAQQCLDALDSEPAAARPARETYTEILERLEAAVDRRNEEFRARTEKRAQGRRDTFILVLSVIFILAMALFWVWAIFSFLNE